ncbi:SDR family oxidoreductase [Actinopolymorpha rutila]|uniref:NAD(P)-dependent dehydrogenase (Short-subunit alcohol dehydrogenase family) n=1 Tax=Actinopolymorpha rutila TaxID=446787 RepID=A0A852ZE22_9ACTN|nr:SDR family NAD(P)-dependent oxidoreductase [Actinopolymorpha rutila]NYH91154.1 NAD(P)-dependent dehydrogenase (short-subunit alcohol dehydrogenase family) [Actinopolymorpha rutila]
MRQAGGGTIVNVASVAGRRGWPNAYCATKFGLTALTQALAAEGSAPHGIRVMSMYPGSMAMQWGSFDPSERTERRPIGAVRSPASVKIRLDLGQSMPSTMRKSRSTPSERATSASW